MSITLEFYPVVEQAALVAEQAALVAEQAAVVAEQAALFKQFNDDLNQELESNKSNKSNKSNVIPFNASECMAFHITNLSFMKALKLAQFVNKDVDRQINESIKEHLKWARKRLYYGLCCYVSDSMYPEIATSMTYVRDLAACFRMAIFNKAITSNIHKELWLFVEAQPIATVMLAVSNFEHESETVTLMRFVHQLAMRTLYVDCCEWYKATVTNWVPEPIRYLEYTYHHHMWLDTVVIVYPATQNYTLDHKKVHIVCLKSMTNPQMIEALARFKFLKVEVPLVVSHPTFNQIQINNTIFERPSNQQCEQHCDPTQEVDKFDTLLLQIKQCQLKLQAPVNYCMPHIQSTLCKDIQDLLASMK